MLPHGTVTFLFTDIEGSTKLWEQHPHTMQAVLSRHDRILENAIQKHKGHVVKKRGDGYHAAFTTPLDAVSAALVAQTDFSLEQWNPEVGVIKVRMSLHTAAALERDGDYYGTQLNRAARLESAAHGGQILVSAATRELVKDELPDGAYLRDLGEHRLKDLDRPEHIYQLVADGLIEDFPPIRAMDAVRTNLPHLSTSFIGRRGELEEIINILAKSECRLLTFVGPGGVGKTRLSIQVASELVAEYPDGVYFVSLTAVTRREYLIPAILNALNFSVDTHSSNLDPKTQLLDLLSSQSMLIVLDNFEQIMDAADLLVEILAAAPRLKFLVTSRERLNLQGEWTFEVTGLSYPRNGKVDGIEGYSAVRLFIERASQVNPQFVMGESDRIAVKRVCQLMEGFPLGIELAAAWINVLTPQEILTEIQKNIDFLASNRRDIPDKHRSLRSVFDYSWRMLNDSQRVSFRKLSVFRGGFTREAANVVADLSLIDLSGFVDKSILRRSSDGRYYLHELLRGYSLEILDSDSQESRDVHQKHSEYYLAFLEDKLPELKGINLKELRQQIRPEIENLRAAMFWIAINWQPDQACEAMDAYRYFYDVQGFHEGVQVFRDIAEELSLNRRRAGIIDLWRDPVYLCIRVIEAYYLSELGEIDQAERICQSALPGLRELDMLRDQALCYFEMGVIANYRGEYEESKYLLEQSLEISQRLQEQEYTGVTLLWLGWVYYQLGETEKALELFQLSHSIFISLNNDWGGAFALSKLGLIYDELKDYQKAIDYHDQARQIFVKFGDRAGEAYTTSRLSTAAHGMQDYSSAIRYGELSLEYFTEIGHRWGMAVSLCRIGFPNLAIGDYTLASDNFYMALQRAQEYSMIPLALYALIGIASVLTEQGHDLRAAEIFSYTMLHPQTPPLYFNQGECWFAEVQARLSPAELAQAEARFQECELDQVINTVLSERLATKVI